MSTEKILWEEIRACREKFEVEAKKANIYWELISEFYEIFTITDLQFIYTDEDVVRHYTLKFKCEYWFDTDNF